jgi:hypothetical protein
MGLVIGSAKFCTGRQRKGVREGVITPKINVNADFALLQKVANHPLRQINFNVHALL